jgi:FtsH-binding integral membrane protein
MFATAIHPDILRNAALSLIVLGLLSGTIGIIKRKTDSSGANRFLIFSVIILFIGIWLDVYLVSL